MTRPVWSRSALLAAAPLLVLVGCGGEEPPLRTDELDPGPTCKTEGTVEAQPAPSLRAAIEPYLEPGHKVRIVEQFSDTAEVQLEAGDSGPDPAVVTLLRTGQGWTVTSVARCSG